MFDHEVRIDLLLPVGLFVGWLLGVGLGVFLGWLIWG